MFNGFKISEVDSQPTEGITLEKLKETRKRQDVSSSVHCLLYTAKL
jgi:hypothetical protein